MRRATIAALGMGGLLLSQVAPAHAINCEQARKYAATGRTAQDIADTMVADVDKVKKCLAAGGSAGGSAAGSGGAAAGGAAQEKASAGKSGGSGAMEGRGDK
ncbi:MAG TPA: hypothetical protein VFD92_18530 [Candidatus Binatia bacterium]|nr:hypothetical protein [Candidatus Binatia bacterium]